MEHVEIDVIDEKSALVNVDTEATNRHRTRGWDADLCGAVNVKASIPDSLA